MSKLETGHGELVVRVDKHDEIFEAFERLIGSVDKLKKYVKIWGPSIVAGLVASGFFNENIGNFIKYLIQHMPN